ncbi:hypothetical protein PG997_011839 [Apiospora hydei]|uniref:Uncharacterized protein n=1 Tax=Apiospora hydei TaxID=1337664 RepID=A0ABR1V2C9_9PEZI
MPPFTPHGSANGDEYNEEYFMNCDFDNNGIDTDYQNADALSRSFSSSDAGPDGSDDSGDENENENADGLDAEDEEEDPDESNGEGSLGSRFSRHSSLAFSCFILIDSARVEK